MGYSFRFTSGLIVLVAWSLLMPASAQTSSTATSSSSAAFDNAAITGNANGSQIVQILQTATNSVYQVFLTVSAGWLVLWCVFLGMAMAFGQGTADDVRNLFFGGAVVVSANLLATAYYAIYFTATGTGS